EIAIPGEARSSELSGEPPAEAPPATAMTEPEGPVVEPTPTLAAERATEPAAAETVVENVAAEPGAEAPEGKPATSVPALAAAPAPERDPAPHPAPPKPAKARTPWFAVFAAGILGAGLTALAAGAAWIYGAPLLEPDISSLNARLTRLEMHTPT